jgi:hypothetical protein
MEHMGDTGGRVPRVSGDAGAASVNTKWTQKDPYPDWPFTRVRGSELLKLMNSEIEEALI